MTRRDSVWLVARIAATAAGQNFLGPWLAAAHEHTSSAPPEPDHWRDYDPQFFSPEEFAALDQFTTILIPTDETPGAKEAHVAPFLDFIVFSAAEYAPEMQGLWRKASRWLTDQGFTHKSVQEKTTLMHDMSDRTHAGYPHFALIKDMVVYAFYTSRVGMIDNLEYKGLAYLTHFPGCSHEEHRNV